MESLSNFFSKYYEKNLYRKRSLILTLVVFFFGIILVSTIASTSSRVITTKLQLNIDTSKFILSTVSETENHFPSCKEHSVSSGESLQSIFNGYGLGVTESGKIASAGIKKININRLYVGDNIKFCFEEQGDASNESLVSLHYHPKKTNDIYHFIKNNSNKDADYTVTKTTITTVHITELVTFDIQTSLYVDAINANMSDYDVMSFVDIFQWDIDFLSGIRKNDKVHVMIEYEYKNGFKTGKSKILVAEYINKNKRYLSYRYEKNNKLIGYFDEKGKSKKKRFLRYPVKFSRISSSFNLNRIHPLFKTARPHRGVDYAAPRHTKIHAASRGKITHSGWMRGYGRTIIINHGNGYSTLYAHMQRIARNAKRGQTVQQNQVIGYVGSTGWATGPHLHYEFRKNGVHKNPVAVKLPGQPPIPRRRLVAYKKTIAILEHEYSIRKSIKQIALLN